MVPGHVVLSNRLFVEPQRIVDAHVKRVLVERLLELGNTLGIASGADQVEAELRTRLDVPVVDAERLAHELDKVIVAVFPVGIVSDDPVQARVPRVLAEHFVLDPFETGCVVGQKPGRRT